MFPIFCLQTNANPSVLNCCSSYLHFTFTGLQFDEYYFWSTLSLHYTSNIYLGKLPYQRHHCRAGTKNSRSEGFWLAKHKHINIPTMMEPVPPSAAWFWWTKIPHPRSLFARGWTRLPSKGFSRINKIKEKIINFYSLSVHYNNCSPVVGYDSQNGINCRWEATIIYKLTKDIVTNNSVARC